MQIDKNKKDIKEIKKTDIHSYSIKEKEDIQKAIAFKLEDDTAIVTSIGIGGFAEKVKKEAEKHNIPIYENKELTEKLINFDINSPVSPEAYELIIAFINFVSHIDKDFRKG